MAIVQTRRKGSGEAAKASGAGSRPRRMLVVSGSWCLALVISAFLPYDRFAAGSSQDFASVPQMADDPPVASVSDVIRVYRLAESAHSYLRVDQNQIYFDAHLSRAPE